MRLGDGAQIIVILASAITLHATLASAQASEDQPREERDEQARLHFDAARQHYADRRWVDAAREFQASYDLSHRSVLLINVATAYERALEFQRARDALRAYLAVEPNAEDRDRIEARIAEYERNIAEGRGHGTGGGISPLMIGTIVASSVAAAAFAIAIGTGVAADQIYQDLERTCVPPDACPVGSSSKIEEGSSLAVASTVTLFIGLGVFVGGAALFMADLLAPGSSTGDTGFRLTPGPGLAGVGAQWTF